MSKNIGAELSDLHPEPPNPENEAQRLVIKAELETWAGITKYWHHIREYAEAVEWEGTFPHGWSDWLDDMALYIFEVEFHSTEDTDGN